MRRYMPRCYFKLSIVFVLILSAFVGCATRKSVLEIPLRYGNIQSSDSIRFTNINIKTLSDAISRIRQTQFYSVQQMSENRYRIVEFDFTENYSGNASLKVERTSSCDILLHATDGNSVVMKIENCKTLVKHSGQPLRGKIDYIVQSDKSGTKKLSLMMPLPADFVNKLNQGLYMPPESYDWNERQVAYQLKEFALLVEEKIQK